MNIYDIAKEAGVSTATVSRVMNNKPNISPHTLKRVKAVLDKYNYVPSSIARGMTSKSMNLVGVVMRDIRHPHYNSFAYTIEQALYNNGYSCILSNVSDCNPGLTFKIFSQIKVDGIIIIGSDFMNAATEQAITDYQAQTPIVFVNGFFDKPNVTNILADDRAGIMLCMEHLFKTGRRKPVYVNDNITDSAKRKREGFMDVMMRNGYTDFNDRIIESALGFEGGKKCGEIILEKYKGDVDCVICIEDTTALGCLRAFETAGVNVPGDIAITGYNNSAENKMAHKVLTSVDTKLEMMGLEAATALYDKMNGKVRASKLTISPELFIGETT